mgnify:CR=1 FL=1
MADSTRSPSPSISRGTATASATFGTVRSLGGALARASSCTACHAAWLAGLAPLSALCGALSSLRGPAPAPKRRVAQPMAARLLVGTWWWRRAFLSAPPPSPPPPPPPLPLPPPPSLPPPSRPLSVHFSLSLSPLVYMSNSN